MNKILEFFKANKFHFIGWAIFIAYENIIRLILGPFDTGYFLIHYVINIPLFYIHASIILPFVFQHKNDKLILGLLIFLECLIYIVVVYVVEVFAIDYLGLHSKVIPDLTFKYYVGVTWKFFYILALSWIYYFFWQLISENRRNDELEKKHFLEIIEKKNMEQKLVKSNYAWLRAQINPPFLFNLLNFFYHETKDTSKKAAIAFLRLSEMMRYSLVTLEKEDFVLVSAEIRQIEHLIYLNQLRFGYKQRLKFNYSKEVMNLKIIPLVILTLVENMFKHGDLWTKENYAIIDLYIRNGDFYIVTVNSLGIKKESLSNHLGLDNIKKRLELIYGTLCNFNYFVDAKEDFNVQISIPLSCLDNRNKK